jgi:outer membrane protein insertion porin family
VGPRSALIAWLLGLCWTALGVPAAAASSGEGLEPALLGLPVSRVVIVGNAHTRETTIRRRLGTQPGTLLSAEQIAEDLAALERLEIFSDVAVTAARTDGEVVVTVTVRETSPYLPLPAFSISDETGVSVGLGIRAGNAFGRAMRIEATVLVGGLQSTELRIQDPWAFGPRIAYALAYYNRQRQNKLLDFFETGHETELAFTRPISDRLRGGLGLGYQSIRSDRDGRTLDGDDRDEVVTLSASLGLDTRDRWTATRRGWWNEIELERTGFFRTQSEFWRLHLDLRRYTYLHEGHTLGLFALASLTSGRVGETVAPWQTYHLGGSNTVRGWDLGSDSGQNQLICTAEYRLALRRMRPLPLPFGLLYDVGLHLAVFADLGWAWSEPEPLLMRDALDGYGVGLRVDSPLLGMLRFDLALGQPGGRVLLHVGSKEKAEMQRLRVR